MPKFHKWSNHSRVRYHAILNQKKKEKNNNKLNELQIQLQQQQLIIIDLEEEKRHIEELYVQHFEQHQQQIQQQQELLDDMITDQEDYEERLQKGAKNCFQLLEEIGELRQKNHVHEETIKVMKETYKRQKEFVVKEYKKLIEDCQTKSTKIKDLEAEIEAIQQERKFAENNYAALQEHIKRLSCEVTEYRNKERAEQNQQYGSKYRQKY